MKTVLLDQNNEVQIIVSRLSELHSSFVNGGGFYEVITELDCIWSSRGHSN